jgi:hypothetical protein
LLNIILYMQYQLHSLESMVRSSGRYVLFSSLYTL